MISRETIDRIFATARIDEVVGDYVSLKRRGANLVGLCPFHDEKTGSFTVSPSKGIYKCFGCGKAGNVASFVREIEQCSYPEALRILAKKYHIPIVETMLTEEEKQKNDDRESMFLVNEYANQWFQAQLWETEEGRTVGLSYFRERGLLDATIEKFHLGYSPDKSDAFYKTAHEKGFDDKFLLNDPETEIGTGLCGKSESGGIYDRFRGRVMFPIHTRSGKTVAFAGRLLKNKEHAGKYINSPGSIIYSKTNQLYGLFQARQAISRQDLCYLVEGQMDVLSMVQSGIENVVCSGGTALTLPQIRLIHPLTNNITVIYDGDAAGIHAAIRGIDMFLEEGFSVKVVLLPDGEDPDSFVRKHNADEVLRFIGEHQTDFIRFKAQLLSAEALSDPAQRSAMIRDVMQSVAAIPDTITRQVYIGECANIFKMHEKMLTIEVNNIRARKIIAQNRRAQDSHKTEVPTPVEQFLQDKSVRGYRKVIVLEENFKNLINFMLLHGTETFNDGDTSTRVDKFIISQLQEENLFPKTPVYRLFFEELERHLADDIFDYQSFFIYHSDDVLSQLVISLLADETGKRNEELTPTEVRDITVQLICETKLSFVEIQLADLSVEITAAYKAHDEEKVKLLAQTQMQFLQAKTALQQFLGRI